MPTDIALPDDADEGEGDLEAELGVIYREATEGRERLLGAAKKLDEANPELAKIYREIAGTVLTLISDLAGTAGEALLQADEDIARLETRMEGAPTESALMPEDAAMYLAYLEQVDKLLEKLLESVPEDAARQREPLEALRRMTAERVEFTKEIMIEEDEPEDIETEGASAGEE
jgi:hypothetical protein